MGVVRGDRIAESRKLNQLSIEAQVFYGSLVARCPDDFGRFRCEIFQVGEALFPRRKPTVRIFRMVARMIEELGEGKLWRSWECDGVTFAELTNWQPTGNHYHRTPEPPWSDHAHNGTCIHTALHQAKQWTPEKVDALREELRNFRGATKSVGADKNGPPRQELFSQFGPSEERSYASGGPPERGLSSSPSVGDPKKLGRATVISGDDGLSAFKARVLAVYTSLPGTRDSPTRADEREALWLYRRRLSADQVEAGITLAVTRRECRTREAPLERVGSLRYFRDAILEAALTPQDGAYLAHLRAKLQPSARAP